jgi:hypothetical protein
MQAAADGTTIAPTPRVTVDISKYDDILQRMGSEAIACIPEAWNTGQLTIAWGRALGRDRRGSEVGNDFFTSP